MGKVKELEAFIAKHNHHISPIVLSVTVVAVLGLVCPTLLLAQESSTTTQFRFQKPPAAASGTRFLGPPISASSSEWQEGSYSGVRAISSSTWTPSPEIMSKLGDYQKSVKDIQSLIDKVKGQGLKAPSSTVSNTIKVGALIEYIKKIQSAGGSTTSPADLPAMIQSLQEEKAVLNKLAAWNKTKTQAQGDVNGAIMLLSKNKAVVNQMAKSGFDVKGIFSQFTTDTAQLKGILDQAQKMVKNDPKQAMAGFETKFADKLNAVKQEGQIMGELGKIKMVSGTVKLDSIKGVSTSFKTSASELQKRIDGLKAKGVDTSGLQAKLGEITTEQAQIMTMLQGQNVSKDSVVAGFNQLLGLRIEFMKAMQNAVQSGVPASLPTSSTSTSNSSTQQ